MAVVKEQFTGAADESPADILMTLNAALASVKTLKSDVTTLKTKVAALESSGTGGTGGTGGGGTTPTTPAAGQVFPASGQSASTADTGMVDVGSSSFDLITTIDDTAWEFFGSSEADGAPGFRAYPNFNSIRTSLVDINSAGTESVNNVMNNRENLDTKGGRSLLVEVRGNKLRITIGGQVVPAGTDNFTTVISVITFFRFKTGGAARPSVIINRV